MWNIKAAIDIMGGGASAPDNIPINGEISGWIILPFTIGMFLFFIVSGLIAKAIISKIKNKNKTPKEHK